MARFFEFFTVFHLSLTFFRPEVPFKGHAKLYGIELQDNSNPLNHLTKAKALVESHLESL